MKPKQVVNQLLSVVAVLAGAGCASTSNRPDALQPGLVIAAPIAEGKPKGADVEGSALLRPKQSPKSSGPTASKPKASTQKPAALTQPKAAEPTEEPYDHKSAPPDPESQASLDQADLELAYDRGKVSLVSSKMVRLVRPAAAPRRMGRFAVELWVGRELVERVRFDFPLLAVDDPKGESVRQHKPTLLSNTRVTTKVRIPITDRPTRCVLVDRAAGTQQTLPWPQGQWPSGEP